MFDLEKIDWKKKLTSRKLWMAIALFVSGLVAHWCSDEVAAMVAGDILQFAAVIGYIFGEGLVDAAAVNKDVNHDSTVENSEDQ